MTDDLSTRLLDAIDRVEVAARSCIDEVGPERVGDRYTDDSGDADRDAFPSYPWGSDERELAYMAGPGHPDSVLRLCQAHREIVELHCPDPEKPYSWGGQTCAECSCSGARAATDCHYMVDYPCSTLRALARGYGIEDQT